MGAVQTQVLKYQCSILGCVMWTVHMLNNIGSSRLHHLLPNTITPLLLSALLMRLLFVTISGEHQPLFNGNPISWLQIKFLNFDWFWFCFETFIHLFFSLHCCHSSVIYWYQKYSYWKCNTDWLVAACVCKLLSNTHTCKKGNLATACFDVKSKKYCRVYGILSASQLNYLHLPFWRSKMKYFLKF